MLVKLIVSLVGAAGAYGAYALLQILYSELTSPFRSLRGPPSAHWFYGNMKQFFEDEDSGLEERWFREYGRTSKFHRFFSRTAIHTSDTKALQHILTHTHIYQKSEASRFSLGRIVGPGILVVEGDQHKQQRKIMNPAFGIPQVRELTEIFVDKSIQLRDIWAAQVAKSTTGVARVEVLSWLSKATLDIIGLAGFNYKIDALGAEEGAAPNELAEAFEALFSGETGFSIARFLQLRVPILRSIPLKRDHTLLAAQATMLRIGRALLADAKRDLAQNGTFETGTGRARDLLSLLVRANTAKELDGAPGGRLADEDVIAQVPTFLVAGHETTSTAVTWTLFALTQNPAAQRRLRAELLAVETDRPSMDDLNALPYLDCVVRETLRVHAPVPATNRIALHDDVLPLSEPVTDANGKVHDTLRMRKGEMVLIPIVALNRDVGIWGPDAAEFVPERWEAAIPGASAVPGIWGHMLTFLAGPRSCIGFRFALTEMKALIFTLVRAFEYELAVPIEDMGKKGTAIVTRPILLTDRAAGNQLPLLVRPVVR
ncbi:cytochrome P450 [Mycena galopus ATCC 62051]|nr:cytochrome P450 [Mycena galopus ATCC 62051]